MLNYSAKNIRTFIGAKKYAESRAFYKALGYEEVELDATMCLFKVNDHLGFCLQDYYVKDWVNNSMVFLEVDDIELCEKDLLSNGIQDNFKNAKFSKIKVFDHGRELFMHDPAGVLWHFCQFNKST